MVCPATSRGSSCHAGRGLCGAGTMSSPGCSRGQELRGVGYHASPLPASANLAHPRCGSASQVLHWQRCSPHPTADRSRRFASQANGTASPIRFSSPAPASRSPKDCRSDLAEHGPALQSPATVPRTNFPAIPISRPPTYVRLVVRSLSDHATGHRARVRIVRRRALMPTGNRTDDWPVPNL